MTDRNVKMIQTFEKCERKMIEIKNKEVIVKNGTTQKKERRSM